MKINLIDPGLLHSAGHHADWDVRITRYLVEQAGHDVCIYSHNGIQASTRALLQEHGEVIPQFSAYPYANPERIDPIAGELALLVESMGMLRAELGRLRAADRWIVPTLNDALLIAIANARPECPVTTCLHTEPDEAGRQLQPASWRYGVLLAQQSAVDIRYTVTVPELVAVWEPVLARSPQAMPLIFDARTETRPPVTPRRIGFFGLQRAEKGLARIKALIGPLLARNLELTVQDSGGTFAGLHGKHERLRVVGRLDTLGAEIATCDLVVVPNQANRYRFRQSGIVAETLAAGVPVVAPDQTASGNLVRQFGAGVLFNDEDNDSILRAIATALRNYPAVARGAERARAEIERAHGCARFMQALLSA